MKSTIEELKKRGFVEDSELESYRRLPEAELLSLMDSGEAWQRTIAFRILFFSSFFTREEEIRLLLEKLISEKALYTKIEICKILEKGNATTAAIMYEYLDKIGTNQHLVIPEIKGVSKKKSYPLPRDIIARSFGRMDTSVFSIWLSRLNMATDNERIISQALDGLGYMAFYNPEVAISRNFKALSKTYDTYRKSDLIVWKLAMCCAAFPLSESKELLYLIQKESVHPTIQAEAERSMRLILKRNSGKK